MYNSFESNEEERLEDLNKAEEITGPEVEELSPETKRILQKGRPCGKMCFVCHCEVKGTTYGN